MFYWFYICYSDAYHCGRKLILDFPIDLQSIDKELRELIIEKNAQLMSDMQIKSQRARIKYRSTGWVEFDKYYPKQSKLLIDQIDYLFAKHYGFTELETDFLINYDIKFRLGKDSGDE